jgi:nucleotide-binding universal stress UspA family protein
MYQRILVPIDGSETSWRGLSEALRLAAPDRSELLLLYIVDDFPTVRQLASSVPIDEQEKQRLRAGEELLTRGLQLARAARVRARTTSKLAVDSTPGTILATAAAEGCELIVIGTHGHGGIRRAVLGSVADHVSRHSPVPVMLVPPSTKPAAAA